MDPVLNMEMQACRNVERINKMKIRGYLKTISSTFHKKSIFYMIRIIEMIGHFLWIININIVFMLYYNYQSFEFKANNFSDYSFVIGLQLNRTILQKFSIKMLTANVNHKKQ